MKQRLTSVDVAAEVACLNQRVVGLRLTNVYDLNAKTYVLKLAKSGEDGEKAFLLLESGSRFHMTQALQNKNDIPSNFTLKIRKHIRGKRLEHVRQLGVDRVVDFVFGAGEACHHLILEMYSQGNLVLTDHKYEVLTLLRSHRDDEKGFAIMARHPYPIHAIRLRQSLSEEVMQQAVESAVPETTLKALVAGVLPYGPAIAEHCVLQGGLNPKAHVGSGNCLGALMSGIRWLEEWLGGLESQVPRGFITVRPGGSGSRTPHTHQEEEGGQGSGGALVDKSERRVMVFNDFNAFPLLQNSDMEQIEFATFDAALEEFFSKIEGQRAQASRLEMERSAQSKLDKIRRDQTARAQTLQSEADQSELRAALIEYNLEAVEAAIQAVNEALATGMDWRDLERMIKEERKEGNPIAALIHSLQLELNQVTLLLGNYLDDEEGSAADDALVRPATKVPVDLSLSAHSNARVHYEAKKKHLVKKEKTEGANEQALKAAEKKAEQQLAKAVAPRITHHLHKPHWFERFHWFITSENYLVISGRDMQQNELLVKRYFRRGDVYVHAELHGASSTIIKNLHPDLPVSPLSLQQAGCACVCRSKAWDQKIVTSAWWVHHHQVSKTAPTGEYLPTGSFMIRGKKNFLPPQPLVMGLAFMFKLEPSCIASHAGERAIRGVPEDEGPERGQGPEVHVEPEAESQEGPNDGGGDSRPLSSETSTSSALASFMDLSLDQVVGARRGLGGAKEVGMSHDKYGLVSGGQGDYEGEDTMAEPEKGDPGAPKRHLSARERAQARKQREGPGPAPQGAPMGPAHKNEKREKVPPPPKGASATEAAVNAQRGKTGKIKKLKDKYAEQDEEDRALALSVLGSAGTKKTRADRRAERKAKKEGARKVALANSGLDVLLDEDLRKQAIARATGPAYRAEEHLQAGTRAGEEEEDTSCSGDDGEEPHAGAAAENGKESGGDREVGADFTHEVEGTIGVVGEAPPGGTAAAEGSAVLGAHAGGSLGPEVQPTGTPHEADDDVAEAKDEGTENEEDEVEEGEGEGGTEEQQNENKLGELDSLTGCPRPEDTLLYAVPVCGPYNALQNYKYKVKLTPGTLKKGKAAKQSVSLMCSGEGGSGGSGATPVHVEQELMKRVPEMDIINALVGTVKLSMAGLQKIKQQEKSQKKMKKKEMAAAGGVQ